MDGPIENWLFAKPYRLFVVTFSILLVIHVIASCNESLAYNRLTGANTTWWDALWVELRVQDSPK